jgi:hypothetical protein
MAIVYQHRRKDTNQVFYVGIGKSEKRAYNKTKRYKQWKDFVKNHDYIVEITHRDVIWEEACSIEKYLISFYGRRDLGLGSLVNQTDGGDGVINLSEDSRSKMSVNRGRFGHLNYFYGKRHTGDLSRFGKQNKGRIPYFKNKKHTEESKQKNREKHLGLEPSNKGSICVNNGVINKYIKQINLKDHLENGWSIGGKKRKKYE